MAVKTSSTFVLNMKCDNTWDMICMFMDMRDFLSLDLVTVSGSFQASPPYSFFLLHSAKHTSQKDEKQ